MFPLASAIAATLEQVSGVVMVNSGNGFRRISNGAVVSPGTRIVARYASSAVLVYEDGCREHIASGESATVKSPEACRKLLATQGVVKGLATLAVGAAVIQERSRPASP